MTLLSIAIPSYNSETYLHYCVHSLVMGGDKVEILIINDGSTDRTQEIAEGLTRESIFKRTWPSIRTIRTMAEL